MDNGRSDLIEVLEGVNDLHDDGAALFLWHKLVLFQVEVQVIALAVLQDCAEPAPTQGRRLLPPQQDLVHQIRVRVMAPNIETIYTICIKVRIHFWKAHICLKENDLRVSVKWKVVIEFNYSWVVQLLVDSIFSACMSETKSIVNTYTIHFKCKYCTQWIWCVNEWLQHSLMIIFLLLISPVLV